ncbi:MAG: YbaN family protein [Candidatus Thiodiazotropha sp.]
MLNMARWGALLLAYLFLALAVVGVILPGLPTVPFLLLSAWFAAKGSQRLHRWLYTHRHFGKLLIDWEQQKAISRSSKVMAVLLISIAWVIMYLQISNLWIVAGMTLLLLAVVAFLLTRPEPQ